VNSGKTLFAQLMDFLPWSTFTRIMARYGGDQRGVPGFERFVLIRPQHDLTESHYDFTHDWPWQTIAIAKKHPRFSGSISSAGVATNGCTKKSVKTRFKSSRAI
jgi:hypothetical protein